MARLLGANSPSKVSFSTTQKPSSVGSHVAAGDRQLSCIYSSAGAVVQGLAPMDRISCTHTPPPTADKGGPAHPSWLIPAILMRGRTRSPTCQVKLVGAGPALPSRPPPAMQLLARGGVSSPEGQGQTTHTGLHDLQW